MHRLLLSFFILLLSFIAGAAKTSVLSWNDIIENNKKITDRQVLMHRLDSLKQLYKGDDKKVVNVIQLVLLADRWRQEVDSLNTESARLYQDALQLSKQLRDEDLQIWVNTETGFYYYRYMEYIQAMPYFLQASHLLRNQPLIDTGIQRVDVLKKNSYYFSTIGYTELGSALLKDAHKIAVPHSTDYAEIAFSLGMERYKEGNLDAARHYYLISQETAIQIGDSIRYAKALGELAYVAMDDGKPEEAIKLLREDIRISNRYGDDRNRMYAQIALANALKNTNKLKEAKTSLQEAQIYLSSKPYLKDFYYQLSEIALEIAKKEKDTATELQTYRVLDSLHHILSNEKMQQANTQVHLQTEAQKFQWQLEHQQKEIDHQTFMKRIYVVTVILLLTLCLALAMLYRTKLHGKQLASEKKIAELKLAMMVSEDKLARANHSLEAHQTYMMERDSALAELHKLKERIKSGNNNRLSPKPKDPLQQMLTSHLMTDENWNRFKAAFIREEPDYFDYIMYMFPDITETNLRLILLLKINLRNAQIANLLGITVEAVKKQKQRLRKKYGDEFDQIRSFKDAGEES